MKRHNPYIFLTLVFCLLTLSGFAGSDKEWAMSTLEAFSDFYTDALVEDGEIDNLHSSELREYIRNAYTVCELMEMIAKDPEKGKIDPRSYLNLVRILCKSAYRVYCLKEQINPFEFGDLFSNSPGFRIDLIISQIREEVDIGLLDPSLMEDLGWVSGDRVFSYSNGDNVNGLVLFRNGLYVTDLRSVGG